MLKRKITDQILSWYKNSDNSLLIDGARQVGKTSIIKNFLDENNIDYLELNLLQNINAKLAFDTSNDSTQLLVKLTALSNKELIPGKTVIFIDEIQEAKDAITPIKFLTQNKNYRFIFSGSLLGIKLRDIASIPVGYLKTLQMYPMDFMEFITAFSVSKSTLDYLKDCFTKLNKVDEIVHKQMLDLFRLYLIVGGMPKVVQSFIDTKDINRVNSELNDIDSTYKLDVSKYKKDNKLLIEDIYDLIPSELNHTNKRFILKNLNEKSRFYQYESSFAWLKHSGIGIFVHNVDNPIYPLLASKERTLFKLFLCDVGLLTYKLFKGNQIVLLNNEDNLNFGAHYEAVTAQELIAHGYDPFYNSDKKRGEIDFLIEDNNEVIPIEVKSGKDYKRHSAMSNLMNNSDFNYKKGYVLSNQNIERNDKIIYLPIYMLMFIQRKQSDKKQIIDIDISHLI